jgi:hypothetical protein
VEEKIQKNKFLIVNSVLKQLIIKHKYNINCKCELCNLTDELNIQKSQLQKNKNFLNYYEYAPVSTLDRIDSSISLLEHNILQLEYEIKIEKLNNLNKINICTEQQKKLN